MNILTLLLNNTLTQAIRYILRFLRKPPLLVSSIIFPGLLLIFFYMMFSGAVLRYEQQEYIQRLLPGILVSSALFGSIPTAVNLQTEINTVIFQRIRSMPILWMSIPFGIIFYEVTRVLISSIFLILIGLILGFSFKIALLSLTCFMITLIFIPLTLSWFSLIIAMINNSPELLTVLLNILFLFVIFGSLSMAPLNAFPEWIQPLISHNPVSVFSEAMRLTALGKEYSESLFTVIIYSVIFLSIAVPVTCYVFSRKFRAA
ncbi:ABC transporter permease [Photorhabdus aegyptia]|uniref:Transport permease protein n=1 Tax=Photorhabdus aegyptia TaxID=2805098 RepID=A0A022PNT2_9GAMM|nr:ABC transporter permease [Photorhabdus aegyptia]EYU16543.1 ABC-2 type transporter [Photorhabdus aegyptia]